MEKRMTMMAASSNSRRKSAPMIATVISRLISEKRSCRRLFAPFARVSRPTRRMMKRKRGNSTTRGRCMEKNDSASKGATRRRSRTNFLNVGSRSSSAYMGTGEGVQLSVLSLRHAAAWGKLLKAPSPRECYAERAGPGVHRARDGRGTATREHQDRTAPERLARAGRGPGPEPPRRAPSAEEAPAEAPPAGEEPGASHHHHARAAARAHSGGRPLLPVLPAAHALGPVDVGRDVKDIRHDCETARNSCGYAAERWHSFSSSAVEVALPAVPRKFRKLLLAQGTLRRSAILAHVRRGAHPRNHRADRRMGEAELQRRLRKAPPGPLQPSQRLDLFHDLRHPLRGEVVPAPVG